MGNQASSGGFAGDDFDDPDAIPPADGDVDAARFNRARKMTAKAMAMKKKEEIKAQRARANWRVAKGLAIREVKRTKALHGRKSFDFDSMSPGMAVMTSDKSQFGRSGTRLQDLLMDYAVNTEAGDGDDDFLGLGGELAGIDEHLIEKQVAEMHIYRREAIEVLQERRDQKGAAKALLQYTLFVCIFFYIILGQRNVSDSHDLELAIKDTLERAEAYEVNADGSFEAVDFEEVKNFDDVFTWTEGALLPLLYPDEEWYNGQAWEQNERNYIQYYNRLVGGFTMVQRRIQVNHSTACITSDRFGDWAPTCWPALTKNTKSKAPFGPEYDSGRYEYSSKVDGFITEVIVDRDLAYQTVAELKQALYLDKATRQLEIGFTVFNPNRQLFSYTGIIFTFLDTGLVQRTFSTESFRLELYVKPIDYFRGALEVLFCIYAMCTFIGELQELLLGDGDDDDGDDMTPEEIEERDEQKRQLAASPLQVRAAAFGKTLLLRVKVYCSNMWNLFDMARLILWCIAFVLYLAIIFDEDSMDLELPLPGEGELWQEYPNLRPLAAKWKAYTFVNAVNCFVILISFFKYLNKSREYGIIVRTMTVAGPALSKYLFVVLICYSCFTVMAMILFGHILPEFKNWSMAMESLCMILSGEEGYGMVRGVGQGAALFYFLFLILMYILMLNILLAILMDAYSTIQGEIKSNEKLNQKTSKTQKSILSEIVSVLVQWFRKAGKKVFKSKYKYHQFITSGMMRAMLRHHEDLRKGSIVLKRQPTLADPNPKTEEVILWPLLKATLGTPVAKKVMLQVGHPNEDSILKKTIDTINNFERKEYRKTGRVTARFVDIFVEQLQEETPGQRRTDEGMAKLQKGMEEMNAAVQQLLKAAAAGQQQQQQQQQSGTGAVQDFFKPIGTPPPPQRPAAAQRPASLPVLPAVPPRAAAGQGGDQQRASPDGGGTPPRESGSRRGSRSQL